MKKKRHVKLVDWTGGIDDLAAIGADVIRRLGRLGMTAPNSRVVRDYVRRGIVSAPTRRGRDAIYGYRQILELIAARLLLVDGWPLGKIAESFPRTADEDLLHLIEGVRRDERASLRIPDPDDGYVHVGLAETLDFAPTFEAGGLSAEKQADVFADRAVRISRIRSERDLARQRLGLVEFEISPEHVVLFPITPWCRLLVEKNALSRLTLEEAEDVGRVVIGTLLDKLQP